jgi:hypothetical protein
MSIISVRPETPVKPWWVSRTLWINLLAAVAIIVQMITGKELFSTEVQAGILALINLVLRLRTNQGLS